jgi:hypothetical protein
LYTFKKRIIHFAASGHKKALPQYYPQEGRFEDACSTRNILSLWKCGKGFFNTFFFTFSGVSSMKRFSYKTALKAVLVGVVISGMATACQNGDGTIGGFIAKDDQATTGAKTGSTATQSDEERKAEQARKIAEFLAKPEVKEMSAGLEEIAQAVAVAVEDKALTNRIYEKCMEKFDGETNTLWMHLEADGKVKSQGGWNKRVDAELSKGRKNATVKGIGNIDAAVKKFEKTIGAPLHLFWMYPSAWDKKTTPIVAFVPFDANPKNRTSIPAFDAKGNRFELGKDGTLAKKRPVIVVNFNERVLVNGTFKPQTITPITNPGNQNGKNNNATVNANGIVNIQILSCFISSSLPIDDFPWDGAPEFQMYLKTSNGTAASAYLGNVPLGVNYNASQSPYYTTLSYSLVVGVSPISNIEWFEDDFASGYDWFDDYICKHGQITIAGPGQFTIALSDLVNNYVSATYRVSF